MVSLRSDLEFAAIAITDTGVGISEDEQTLIFSRFHRSTDTRSLDEKGVGLGLSIARSIAESHAGRIDIQRAPGKGSTFTILLPLHHSR